MMDPNLDSLLPPGEVFRKTFDTALMGLESKGGGGGQKGSSGPDWDEVADLQHEHAMNSYNYDWDNTQRSYNHQILQNIIQRRDQVEQHQYQTAQQEQQWMYANAVKEAEYNAQVAAYNKSERMYETQLQMNKIAADMAVDDQTAQTDERYQALGFQAEAASLDYLQKRDARTDELRHSKTKVGLETTKAKEELRLDRFKANITHGTEKTKLALKGIQTDAGKYSKQLQIQDKKEQLTTEQQTKRGLAALESQENMVKGLQALGAQEAKGQAGRSAAKQYQALAAQNSRLQAAKAYELNRSDKAYRIAQQGLDKTLAESEAAYVMQNASIGLDGLTVDATLDITKKQLDNTEKFLDLNFGESIRHLDRSFDVADHYAKQSFGLGTRERDATRLSIHGAHGRALKKIEYDNYAANIKADFNRMSKPSMGVPIPKPLEIPMATIMDPLIPVRGKKPVWGAGMGAGPSSSGSTGGGGMVSGLMTGAGSLAMGAGAVPGLLAAGSAIPGIGLGVAAVGMIGGALGLF